MDARGIRQHSCYSGSRAGDRGGAGARHRREHGRAEAVVLQSFLGSVHAPDFPDGLDWLNVERPLAMRELRGRLVILDFWTFC